MSKRVRYDGFRAVPRLARLPYTPRARGRLAAQMVNFRRNRQPKGAIQNNGRKELKYIDVTHTGLVCDTTGTITAINLSAVGDDNTTRDGREITIKSVQLQGLVAPIDSDINPNDSRVMLVWDNAVNGALPTIANILSTANAFAFPLVDNSDRFTILLDSHSALGQQSSVATQAIAVGAGAHCLRFYKRMNSIVKYNGTTALIASVQNGGMYLVTVGSQAAGLGGSFSGQTRVRFTDN